MVIRTGIRSDSPMGIRMGFHLGTPTVTRTATHWHSGSVMGIPTETHSDWHSETPRAIQTAIRKETRLVTPTVRLMGIPTEIRMVTQMATPTRKVTGWGIPRATPRETRWGSRSERRKATRMGTRWERLKGIQRETRWVSRMVIPTANTGPTSRHRPSRGHPPCPSSSL